ncbi:MAG: protein-L-isoaspartate(D-aspartate) O-methyltransferase [Thermoplasmatota archaeon]
MEAGFELQRERLVESLKARGYVTSPEVERAMRSVRRHLFVPEWTRADSYDDRPLDIGEGQTISAPHMVAIMAEALELERGQKVLEVGGGSGYHAAVVASIVAPGGHVFSVERIASLAERARASLEAAGLSSWVTMVVGDGSRGLPEHAPYDRIFVACAAPDVPPPLFEQLREGGKLLVPVGPVYAGQELIRVEKRDGRQVRTDLGGCVFVPLIGEHGFKR